MTWRKGEFQIVQRCNQCRAPVAVYCRQADEYLCEECFTEACLDKDQTGLFNAD